ncbi:MAG: TonB-dependent receptor [Bacteroides sp.]|nr:TonB-dependent receptor [Bacteroides sp.]MCM1413590.1 TonB-dependent receptor [Bacteroides sp.]MCM1471193.1 TonB-dependent receptor [Bacteroides sp.]
MRQKRSNGVFDLALTPMVKGLALTMGVAFLSAVAAPPASAQSTIVASAAMTQQSENATGTVYDSDGEPLVGVSVLVKGTQTGTMTDANGRFSLRANKGQTLIFKYVGFDQQEAKVTGAPLEITMSGQQQLDEVVVVGYGTVRKADLAGAVSVLDNRAFQAQPITQAVDALQGRVAGVNVVSDGVPGGSVRIRIRGSNSINKSNDPLYVVDGLVRESGLDGINPDDIASMQILKDASSTAIYGSRGANGVVIVTTKKGHVGESKITFDAQVGFSNATRLPDMLGTQAYANALVKYAGIPAVSVQEYLDGTNPGIDWKDEMFRTGVTQNYTVTFSKGKEDMQFYLSANYMKNEGIIKNSQYERFSARANMSADVTKWLNVNAEVNASHGNGHGIGGLAMGGYNPIWIAFNSSPTMEMMTDGVYNMDPYGTIQNNPVGIINAPNERRRDVFTGHVDLRFKIIPGLTFTTSNGVDYYQYYGYGQTVSNESPTITTGMSNSNTNRWLLQSTNNLTYIGTFNEKHNLTATAVWEATKSTTRTMGIDGKNLIYEGVGWWNVNNAKNITAKNGYSEWALLSAVARAIYNYDNRYMLTATFRADGSSRLTNNKWSYFPSVAAAWTISNEDFFESIKPTVSNLKLRASWGIIGNQDISPYETLAMLSQTQTYYGTSTPQTGYWANKVGAPDLKWEKTKQFDLGIDAAFLNGRIDVTLDYFYKRTSDALLRTSLANYLGGSSYWVNAGEVSNTGLDIAITADVIQSKDWNWTTTLNGSILRNRVEKMSAQQPILYSGSMQSIVEDACVIMEGQPIGVLYGYQWAGIDADGYDTYYTADGNVTRNPASTDRVVLGKANPSFTLGWNNTVTWKNWSLNAFFTGQFGAKRINALRYAMCTMTGNSRMITSPDGINGIGTSMPDPSVDNNYSIGNSSKWVESANYFRLENITLSYDFKRALTRFADVRLSFSIQNLFTITGYKGCNPASYSFNSDYEWAQGVDTGTSPAPRTFTFGARLTF